MVRTGFSPCLTPISGTSLSFGVKHSGYIALWEQDPSLTQKDGWQTQFPKYIRKYHGESYTIEKDYLPFHFAKVTDHRCLPKHCVHLGKLGAMDSILDGGFCS